MVDEVDVKPGEFDDEEDTAVETPEAIRAEIKRKSGDGWDFRTVAAILEAAKKREDDT
jgi:hypothetical protein